MNIPFANFIFPSHHTRTKDVACKLPNGQDDTIAVPCADEVGIIATKVGALKSQKGSACIEGFISAVEKD